VEATDVPDSPGPGCGEFFEADPEPGSLRQFLVGADERPQPMDAATAERELNDRFATELLREGVFPRTAEDLLAKLDAKIGVDDPLSKATQRTFVVAEGSQVAKDPSLGFDRNLRFLVTRGQGGDGADLMISIFQGGSRSVEVMAWDDRVGGFNYYRTLTKDGAEGSWVWAGNSRHAWEPGTRGSGPFESHPTGNFLFKEFKLPWVHWHGPPAIIDELDLQAGDPRATHEWFESKAGAYVLEDSVAVPAIKRWNRRRLEEVQEAGVLSDPVQLMERFLGSTELRRLTVNLVSSRESNADLATADRVRLPGSFFVDADAFVKEVLNLEGPPALTVSGEHYRNALAEFAVFVRNHDGEHPLGLDEQPFERPGDTHFLFLVPERAFEDTDFVRQLVKPKREEGERELGLISERLAGCLLMVDFPNPVFSARRTSLLRHVDREPLPAANWGTFSERLGGKIAAASGGSGTQAEDEFAKLWKAGDGWRDFANDLLKGYYKKLTEEQLATADGFRDIFRLAEARRNRVRTMPINEAALLFAQTSIPPESVAGLAMSSDATVEQRQEGEG
jgi:hypothetical protein